MYIYGTEFIDRIYLSGGFVASKIFITVPYRIINNEFYMR